MQNPKHLCIAAILVLASFLYSSQPNVSVLYFDNIAGNEKYAYLGKALSEMLISELAGIEGLTVIEREQLEKLMKEIALGMSGIVDEKTSPKVGKILGANYIISGSYLVDRTNVSVDYKIVAVEKGSILEAGRVEGRKRNVLELKQALVHKAITSLQKVFPRLKPLTHGIEQGEVSVENIEEYGKALDFKDRGEYKKAAQILNSLKTKAPKFQPVQLELSAIEKRLAEYDKKRKEMLAQKQAEPGTWQSFHQITASYFSSMQYTKLLEYCESIRDNPPKVPEGSITKTAETLDYYIVLAHYFKKHWSETVKEGENFVKNYPTSMYYRSVKTYLNQAINELKNRDTRLKKADTKAKKFITQLASARPFQRSMIYFQIAALYLSEKIYIKALEYYKKVNVKVLEENGITGDNILLNIFICYYYIQDKPEAQKIAKTVETFYPESSSLTTIQNMLVTFPE